MMSNSSTYGVDFVGVKCTAAQLVSGMFEPGTQWPSLVHIWPDGHASQFDTQTLGRYVRLTLST